MEANSAGWRFPKDKTPLFLSRGGVHAIKVNLSHMGEHRAGIRSDGHAPADVPPVLPRVEPPELPVVEAVDADARTSPVATHISKQRSDIHLPPTLSPTVRIPRHDNALRPDIILSPVGGAGSHHLRDVGAAFGCFTVLKRRYQVRAI